MATADRRQFVLQAAAAALALALPLATRAQTAAAKHKVVFQVSDGDVARWNIVLNNLRNLQDGVGRDNAEVELVAYGPGVNMLKADSAVGERVADAVKNGVKVVACENTMRAFKLTHADMLQSVGYVPSGVVELMAKQQQGYAYLRP